MARYEVRFPAHYKDGAPIIESKGWLEGVIVSTEAASFSVLFADPVRLSQEVGDANAEGEPFAEPNLVVIPSDTRETTLDAIARLSRSDFAALRAD